MVADDAKKGSIPIRVVNQAKSEVRSKAGKWEHSDQDQMGARWVAQEFKRDGGPRQ